MGLFTRTVLLLALIYLSVTFGVGIAKLNDGAPSDVDRLVRARYERHRIAARAAFVDGGEVTNPTVSSYVPAGSGGAAHDSAVGQFNKPGHPADASALSSVNFVLVDQVTKKNDELKASKLKSADTERQEVADLAASVSRKLISFNANTAHMRRFALEVRPFVNGLSDSAMYLIQTQESLQILAQEERDLLMAEQSLINQKSRIEESMAALEDEIDSTQREHVRVAELVARYTSVNPSIAKDLTAAGTPWVDGRVIWAGQDARVGMMRVSIGSADGLRDNQVVSLQRNGRFVGRARVESLQDNTALLRMQEEFLGTVLPRIGDTITGRPNLGE